MKKILLTILMLLFTMVDGAETDFNLKPMDFNLKDTPIIAFLEMIAKQAGLSLVVESKISGNISYYFSGITPKEALEKVANENGFSYELDKNKLIIFKDDDNTTSTDSKNTKNQKLGKNMGGVEYIPLKYLEAKNISNQLMTFIGAEEKLVIDEPSNSVTLIGSTSSANKIRSFLQNIDTPPIQIVIEVQIVEMTRQISRELGVSLGDLSNPDLVLPEGASATGIMKSSRGLDPNLSMGLKIGNLAGSAILAKIDAAEQSGEAKVISRPKVATLNNLPATINSGITYNVKTASQTESGATSVGSIQSIKAGLNLKVTPSKIGEKEVKLEIILTNSEPNNSSIIDGIPSINDNTANATIIIGSGETAVMAGFVKQTSGSSQNGVPWLSNLPFLGWLFKSKLEKSASSELMILITPQIVESPLPKMQTAQLEKTLDINNLKSK